MSDTFQSGLQFARDIRPHSILDPIHGLIRLTDLEFAVLDDPLFQRLRKVKQNGLLYMVFPSATHTRFEHSIGAMHVADSMLEQLWLNSLVGREKEAVAPFASETGDVAIDFAEVPDEHIRWIVRITRLAALVHDLGHGPLSHTFDSFALHRDDLQRLLMAGVVRLGDVPHAVSYWERRGLEGSVSYDRVPHEVMSCVFFAHVWSRLGVDVRGDSSGRDAGWSDLPLVIAACVLGRPEIVGESVGFEHRQWIRFVHDLIASAPADADRMDYLERDSRALGVSYGLFDRNRVLKSFLCFRHGQGDQAEYRLGVKRSGIPAMENLVQARFELYVQVYHHKTNQAISLMLKSIALRAHEENIRFFDVNDHDLQDSFNRIVDKYVDLSDDQFMRVLRGKNVGYPIPPTDATATAEMIEQRALWKRLFEGDEQGADYAAATIRKTANKDIANNILLDVSKPGATKDLDSGATLLSRDESGFYTPIFDQSWYAFSIVIKALKEAEGNIGRLYAKGSALEASAFSELTSQARRLGRQYDNARQQADLLDQAIRKRQEAEARS